MNKVSINFTEDYQLRQTPEDDQYVQWSKGHDYHNQEARNKLNDNSTAR